MPELRAYAQRNGWPVQEYQEEASARLDDPHPVLAQLLEDAKVGKFQVVLCGSLHRFGSSVQEVMDNIVVLHNAGARFICTSQPGFDIDPRNAHAKILLPPADGDRGIRPTGRRFAGEKGREAPRRGRN